MRNPRVYAWRHFRSRYISLSFHGHHMRIRIFAIALVGALICTASALAQAPATSTDVIVATVRVLSPTDPADRFEILDAAIRQGVAPRREPLESDAAALQAGSPELRVLAADGTVLYRQLVTWSRVITVPPPAPGTSNAGAPNAVVLERPEVTVVMPAPPGAARVELFVPGGLRPAAAQDVKAEPSAARAQPITAATANDPSTPGALNVLLLASGFTDARISTFPPLAVGIQSQLLNAEPFRSQSSRVIFRAARATTNLGCAPGCDGIERLMCCNNTAVVNAALASGLPFDEIIVVHDTPTYAGAGYRDFGTYRTNSYNTFTTAYNGIYTEEMVMHEFGHSFGDLCDEYTYSTEPIYYHECANCRPSCTDLGPFGEVCTPGCDAAPSYFRPEDSVMLDLLIPAYNNASINTTTPVQGLASRLQYFTNSTGGPAVPGAATGLIADVSGNNVTLRWNAAPAATSYTLQVGGSSGSYGLLTIPLGNTTTISGAAPNATYFWRVLASNAAGSGPPSTEAQFTVGPVCIAPSAPQNFSHSVVGRTVTLTWTAPAAGAGPITYLVDVGAASGLANILSGAPLGNGSSISVGAPPGTYYVRLRAQNACGVSAPSLERVIVVP